MEPKFPKVADEDVLVRGMNIRPPCRMEEVDAEKKQIIADKYKLPKLPYKIIMDGGHNPMAMVPIHIYIYLLYIFRQQYSDNFAFYIQDIK